MAENRISRRRTLRMGVAGLTATSLAGCSGILNDPRFVEGWNTQIDESILTNGPTPTEGPPFSVALVTSTNEANRTFDWSVFRENQADEWKDVDYTDAFVAVLVSRLKLTEAGTFKGWCPRTDIRGESFVFGLTFESWLKQHDPSGLFTQVERWLLRGNSPPTRAKVDVTLDPSGETKSCSD